MRLADELLVFEHLLLGGGSAGGAEAAEAAVGAEDAVAGDDQGDRIGGHDAADGSGGAGPVKLLGQIAVSPCLAERYGSAGIQDLAAERRGAVKEDRWISTEIDAFTLEIGDDPLLEVGEKALIEADILAGGVEAQEQLALGHLAVRRGQAGSTDGVFCTSQAEIAPFRPEDRVIQHSKPPCFRSIAG